MKPSKNTFAFGRLKGYLFILFLSVLIWLLLVFQSFADTNIKYSLTIAPDKQFEFAEHYFDNGDYKRAIGEYHRFIYFFPGDTRGELVRFKIGMSYYKDRNFREAITAFESLIDKYKDTRLSMRSFYKITESRLALNETDSAIAILQHLVALSKDPNDRDKAFYRLGWIYIDRGKWEKARSFFSNISKQNRNKYRLKHLTTELAKEIQIQKKNPRVAGLLSILPGAGYLYVERYQDALISFLLIGGIGYAAYESFDNDQPALGGLLSVVGLGFYAGNIYGSISSAHKYNRTKSRRFIEKLKENTKVNLSTGHTRSSILLSFHYLF